MGVIKVKGAAKVARLYNITRLEMEGVDFSEYDLESAEDVKELFEIVNDFVESGEADAIEPPLEIEGADPDECTFVIEDKSYFSDELTLQNIPLEELLESLQEAEVGDIYYVRTLEGDGQWLIETEDEIDPQKLRVGYVDCALYFDQYDVLREGYLDVICDTVLPREIRLDNQLTQVSEFIFDPQQIYGQLYKVVEDPTSGVKVLHKIDYGGRVLAGTDFIVDDFEAN